MVYQINTVEQFERQVDQVKIDLDMLKKETSEEVISSKMEELEKTVITTKDKINKKLSELKVLGESSHASEIAKLETMLVVLETSMESLSTLKSEIISPIPTSSETESTTVPFATPSETNETPPQEKKNRLRRQIDGFSDKTEENHGRKNAGRIALGIGAGVVVWKGIKRIFGIGKKKEKQEEGSTEKKGFRQRPFGKFLKWTGIGTGAYYVVHGLATGRWGLKDFFNRDKKEKIDPEDLKSRYEKEVSPALKPKYDKFAGMVDEYHKAAGSTASLGVLEDKEKNRIEIPRGAIPAAMDNAYDNVGDILNTSSDIMEERARVGGKLRGLVGSLGGAIVGSLLKPMIGAIKGLKASMFGSNGEPNEEFKKRAEEEDLTRDEQVANLLQKYSMVRVYLNDKRKQLRRKYIIEQLKTEKGISNPTDKQIEDYDLNSDLIDMRMERDFLSKKIVHADSEGSVTDALENQGILDASLSRETQAVIDEVKNTRKEIIPDETIWERSKQAPDINQNEGLRTELNGISTRFSAHLKEGILHRNILEGIANMRGILNLDELRNSRADDLEEAMEKLGFGDEIKRFTLQNSEFYAKLQSKTLTKTDIENFEKTINNYFSLLQQVLLETQSQQENEGSWEVDKRFMGRMWKLVSTPGGWIIMGSTVLLSRSKHVRNFAKGTVHRGLKPGKLILRQPVRRYNVPGIAGDLGNRYLKWTAYGNYKAGYDNFVTDIKKGRIGYKDANYVFSQKHKHRGKYGEIHNAYFNNFMQNQIGVQEANIDVLSRYLDNKNMRRILNASNVGLNDLAKKLITVEEVMNRITDTKVQKFSTTLLNSAHFKSLGDLDVFMENVKKIDPDAFGTMTESQIKKLAKEIGKDMSNIKNADQLNAKIRGNVVSDVVDVIDDVKIKKLNGLIDIEFKSMKNNLDILNNSGSAFNRQRRSYYEGSLQSLESLKNNSKALTNIEYDNIMKLTTHGFDVSSIAKLHRMTKVQVKGANLIQEAMNKGDLSDVKRALTIASEDVNFVKHVPIEDIHSVIAKLDNVGKNALKATDDVGMLLKTMLKIFTKIT